MGGSGISARGGRRPRPLAIPTDSHFHSSTILGHLVIGGDEVSDNLTVLRQLIVKSVGRRGYHLFSVDKVTKKEKPAEFLEGLVQYVAKRRIMLEVCLTSNRQTM